MQGLWMTRAAYLRSWLVSIRTAESSCMILAGSFLRAGAYADAVCYLEEALKLEPGSLPVSSSLAVALRRMGRYAEAERVYLEALREGNGAPHLLFNLGRLYVDWKKWDRAVKAAQCTLRLEPGFSEARRLLEYSERESPSHIRLIHPIRIVSL